MPAGGGARRGSVALAAALLLAGCGAGSSTAEEPSRTTRPAASTTAAPTPTTTTTAATTTTPPTPAGTGAVVTAITDGDTIRVRTVAGADERVRLIGIDTPETRDPRQPVECFGREATAQTAALLPIGTAVTLELDVEHRDRYERLLAYVWRTSDGLHVNESLVASGWAAPFTVPPNVRYADRFSELGRSAREQGLGLWSACGGVDTPAAAMPPAPAAAAPGDCDANYVGACVPRSNSDLDCSDVGVRRFQVVGADPHGFDGDADGIACE